MTLAATSTKSKPTGALALRTVPISHINIAPQVRKNFDAVSLGELAGSIASVGLQHPPLCREREGAFEIVDGERRFRACVELLGWKEMPILVMLDEADATNTLARQLVCNLQRADLNVIEKGLGIQSLMTRADVPANGVAKLLGLSGAAITRALRPLTLPEDIQQLVIKGDICADSAYMLSRLDDPDEQRRLAGELAGGRMSRDALARKLKSSRRSGERRAAGATRCTAVLGNCSVTFDGPGLSLDTMIEWVEQLLSRARKAKSQGLTLQTFASALRDQANEGKGGRR